VILKEGKSKRVFKRDDGLLILEFKDEITARDGAVRDIALGKGALSAKTSAMLFEFVSSSIPTHYKAYVEPNKLLVIEAEPIPIEVIVRRYAYGSMLKRIPIRPMKSLNYLVEFHWKNDDAHDPLVLPEDVIESGLMTREELHNVSRMAVDAFKLLEALFARANCTLIDAKFEFGRSDRGLLLIDEISGDTIRVLKDGEHLDKEYYRRTGDVRGLLERYEKLASLVEHALLGLRS